MKKVLIYSTSTCHYCKVAKEFFERNNIAYEEADVYNDLEKRHEMMQKSGQMGVPVIDIDGEIIVGFNMSKISSLLDIKSGE